ncbi:MAG: 6-phosphofructokinase, partial [Planctomycetota bacterium]
ARRSDLHGIARTMEAHGIQGLLVIGGLEGYEAAWTLWEERENFAAFDMPILCLPASIDNNLPGSEVSIGADTAVNSITRAVDAIKQSAVASRRAFVVEVMGNYCGYLALSGGLATGAERVYLHEEGVTLEDLKLDVCHLVTGFEHGKRLGLMIRNERANAIYDTDFMCKVFEEEGGDLFEVRKSILGHLQQGGDPTPFDRIQATRLAARCIEWLDARGCRGEREGAFIGIQRGHVHFHELRNLPRMIDRDLARPREQWWMGVRPTARILARPAPRDELDCPGAP